MTQTVQSEQARHDLPLIVGLGGTMRSGSSSERLLRHALSVAETLGAQTELFAGPGLDMPNYSPDNLVRTDNAVRLIDALRHASGVIIASPGYHGSFSGMIKNALDYTEDMANDVVAYLENRPVGLIACAAGWQGAVGTLAGLRAVIHALRGWPTPFGVVVNSAERVFDANGDPEPAIASQLAMLVRQVVQGPAHDPR